MALRKISEAPGIKSAAFQSLLASRPPEERRKILYGYTYAKLQRQDPSFLERYRSQPKIQALLRAKDASGRGRLYPNIQLAQRAVADYLTGDWDPGYSVDGLLPASTGSSTSPARLRRRKFLTPMGEVRTVEAEGLGAFASAGGATGGGGRTSGRGGEESHPAFELPDLITPPPGGSSSGGSRGTTSRDIDNRNYTPEEYVRDIYEQRYSREEDENQVSGFGSPSTSPGRLPGFPHYNPPPAGQRPPGYQSPSAAPKGVGDIRQQSREDAETPDAPWTPGQLPLILATLRKMSGLNITKAEVPSEWFTGYKMAALTSSPQDVIDDLAESLGMLDVQALVRKANEIQPGREGARILRDQGIEIIHRANTLALESGGVSASKGNADQRKNIEAHLQFYVANADKLSGGFWDIKNYYAQATVQFNAVVEATGFDQQQASKWIGDWLEALKNAPVVIGQVVGGVLGQVTKGIAEAAKGAASGIAEGFGVPKWVPWAAAAVGGVFLVNAIAGRRGLI